ncbi:MAG TPA: efflux RND transporter permease subunit [Sulfurimonas sp.]|uniref:efflux RND transporter permease subunit n=1 Tax=Sulfurimonas sp. TaxID=2022749 RepID=UPI002B77AE33|nr:efflux RND transporter permease subunit [Sulfurimonas sp.]HUH42643.1 efflux RND transporter permease subunit [Sulfurimonas sp.]
MTKKLITVIIKNSSLNHILFIFLLLAAYVSYTKIPKEMFPPSSLDMISVQGYYVGANPDVLDKLIVRDIEKILQNNQYLENINTVISNGTFYINSEIKNSKYMQQSIDDIKNNIQNLKQNLPQDMDIPIVKAVENFFPLLSISISSSTNQNYIDIAKELQDDIKKLSNLHSVELDGNYDSLMVISLDEQKLLAYGISSEKLYAELMSLYSLHPIGSISSKTQKYYIESKNSNIGLDTVLDSEIVVDSKILSLRDIAKIKYDYEEQESITRTNGEKSVILNIKKAKAGDSIVLSKKIREITSTYKQRYDGINFEVLNDSSFWIKNRLNTISSNIIIGLILLFLSIWLFISLKIAIVVLLGIPVSFAFGLIGLDFFDASLNTLSMIGVLLSLGILVDEAIVVSENIHRHLNMQKDLTTACIDATHELMPILFASMLTTIIAFLPLTMLSGSLGVFIKIIPLIVIILVVSSFIESFIFLPLHYKDISYKFLKEKKKSYRDILWQRISKTYERSLHFFIKKRYLWGFLIIMFTFSSTFLLIRSSNFQLFPEFDAMSINLMAKVKNNSLLYTLDESKKLEALLLEKLDSSDVASISTIVGMNSDGRSLNERGDNLFSISVNLKQKTHDDFFNKVINPLFTPYKEENPDDRSRELYAKEIKEKIEFLLNESGLRESFLEFNINIPQTGVLKSDVEIGFSHRYNEKIKESMEIIQEKMRNIDGVVEIKNDMNQDELKVQIRLNSYGKSLGFTQEMLSTKVRAFVSRQKLSKIVDTNSNLVELKVDFLDQDNLESLYNLSLNVPSHESFVCLKDIASVDFTKDTTTIKKEDLNKIFTISADFDKKKMNSRKFYNILNPTIEKLRHEGIEIFIKGEEKTNEQIKKDIFVSLVFTIFAILTVLIWLFGSFWLSIFALSVIPFSLLGALVGHKIMGINISFSSVLGFIGLIGIVINDTLIMLEIIKDSSNKDELIQNASMRVRPILLTSITTIIGLGSLIFFASGESLLMQPIAISIGFGLMFATIINLYYLPIIYSFKNTY